jgi:hypothetical protein
MPSFDVGSLTVNVKIEKVFLSKKRKVGIWTMRLRSVVPRLNLDMAIIARDGKFETYAKETIE